MCNSEIIISQSGTAIALPPDTAVARAMNTKPMRIAGSERLVTAYTPNVCKLLRTVGVDIATPFSLQYKWPARYTPFEAQQATAELFTQEPRAYCLNDMGTGKTVAALAAADWLIQRGAVHRVLVVSPLSTLALVWAREIFSFCPQYKSAVLHGTRDKRRKLLDDKAYTFYIINHDAVNIIADEVESRLDIDLVIIDELAEYRTPRTRRWNVLSDLCQLKRRVWGMTGTPRPNAPTDVWAQVKLVTPQTVGMSFKAFKDLTMRQVTQFRWVEKPDANKIAFDAMQPSVRYRRDQCVDLPPLTYSFRSVTMAPQTKRAYVTMMKKLHMQSTKGTITAVNAGVLLNKLLQISLGWVYDDNGNVVSVDPADRIRVLIELINEAGTKTLVFVPFVHALQGVSDGLFAAHITNRTVYGQSTAKERNDTFHAFKYNSDPQVLVAHPQTMSHGLNFEHAATIIWFGPLASYATYDQANARITRPGQKNPMHIVRLTGSEAEQKVYNMLAGKQTAQDMLLSLFD